MSQRDRRAGLLRAVLYRPWLYVILAALAAMCYGRLWLNEPAKSSRASARTETSDARQRVQRLMELRMEAGDIAARVEHDPMLRAQLSMWFMVSVWLTLGGCVLTVRALRRRTISAWLRFRGSLTAPWSYGDAVRMLLLIGLIVGLWPCVRIGLRRAGWPQVGHDHAWGLVSTLAIDLMAVAIVWAFASLHAQSLGRAIGVSRRTIWPAIGRGLAGYVTMFPWLFGLLWLTVLVCSKFGIEPPVEPIHELLFLERTGWIVVCTAILACVVGPIAEEIVFRGVLFGTLRMHASRRTAFVVSSAVFAAVHTNPVGFLPIFVLGCVLADRYEQTGSLAAPIAVHIVHNTFLIGVALTLRAML